MISPAWVRSSSPTITRHGRRSASSTAPLIALWSVMHSTSMPDSTTASAISSGVVVESPLHIVWLCMSTRTQPGRQRRGEMRMASDGGGEGSWHERQRYPARLAGVRWTPRRRRFMLITGGSGFLGQHLGIASEAEELGAVRAAVDDDRRPPTRAGDRGDLLVEADGDRAPRLPQGRSPHDRRGQPQRRRGRDGRAARGWCT